MFIFSELLGFFKQTENNIKSEVKLKDFPPKIRVAILFV